MDTEDRSDPKQGGEMVPQGEVVVGAGEAVVLPNSKRPSSWRNAENHPDHQPISVGPDAACSCGWTGSGWAEHVADALKA